MNEKPWRNKCMHDYSIERHPKEKILFSLAMLSILCAPVLKSFADQLLSYLEVGKWWGSAPAIAVPVFSLFIGFYSLFNHFFWRIKFFRKLLVVPDLNGTWQCKGHTVLKNSEPADIDWKAEIVITQTWSRILIYLKSSQSESKSISASISHEKGIGYRLLYQYNNKPKADEMELKDHTGAIELLFSEDILSAHGSYFTDKNRTTVGNMSLTREKR